MASLCPAEMSESAVRRRPLSDWPAARDLRATTTSSELPSLRVWWLKLSYYLRYIDVRTASTHLLVRPHSTPTAQQRIVPPLPGSFLRKVFYLMGVGLYCSGKVFNGKALCSKCFIQ